MPNDKKIETRSMTKPAEVETRNDGRVSRIFGYAAVFNSDSDNFGFVERIAPGAFKNALKKSGIVGLKNHDENLIFAREGVNLTLREDAHGLFYEATPVDTRNYQDTAREIQSGLLTGQSFSFKVNRDKWSGLQSDTPTRTILDVDIIKDVGPVTHPAYPNTDVAFRSMEHAKETPPDETRSIVLTVAGEEFMFASVAAGIDKAIEKLKSLKPADSPMTDAADNEERTGGPMTENASDIGNETIEQIDNLLARY